MQSTISKKPWYSILYIQVLIAVLIGITVGNQFPELGKALSL
jgi:aerobic C4-dicarboxylate transport protein